jgi:choline kinase
VPLIERVIRSAMQAEIDDFYLVSGYEGDRVRHFLDGLARRCRIKITNIVNDAWQQGNGLSRWWRPRWRASLLVNHLPHFRRTHGPMV